MYCRNCGTQLDDNARFCFSCGTKVNEAAPAAPTPTPERPSPKPSAPKKAPKKRIGLTVLIAVAALLAVTVGVFAAGIFGSDSARVAAALAKSGKAFTDAADRMALTDVSTLVEDRTFSQELSLWVEEVDGSTAMSGLGVRLDLDGDLPGRNLGMSLTPFFGSADLLRIQMKLEDEALYLGSPELTGGSFYMINTETICQDLQNMGADMGEAAQMHFNFFDLVELSEELYGGQEELTQAVKEAALELAQTVEVEKSGSETLEVNGTDLKCTAYEVLIPEAAIHTFLDALEAAYRTAQNPDAYGMMLEAMGMPAEIIAEMEAAMGDPTSGVTEAFSQIHYAAEQLGDLRLDLYLHDGYVVAAVYEGTVDGLTMTMGLYIGGGDHYVDDISLTMGVDGEEYRITSSGDHTGSGNVFTDKTRLEYVYDGERTTLLELEASYAPNQLADNLNLKLVADEAALQLRGHLTCKKDSMDLRLDRVTISQYGEKLAVFGMEFAISKYQGDRIPTQNSQALAGMTEEELYEVIGDLSANAYDWAMNLDSGLAEQLAEIFYELY